MILRFVLLVVLGLGLGAASPWSESTGARLRLLAGAKDRGAYWAAIEIVLDNGWKTYWRMPGDSGIPPRIDASASRNLAALEILWPAPVRFKDAGGTSIGYKGTVTLPVHVRPIDPKAPVILDITVQYGVCKHLCAPAEGRGNLILFASGVDEQAVAAARARVPEEVPAPARDTLGVISATPVGDALLIAVDTGGADPATVDVFAEGPPTTVLSPPERVGRRDGHALFRLRLNTLPIDKRDELAFTVTAPGRSVVQHWHDRAPASK